MHASVIFLFELFCLFHFNFEKKTELIFVLIIISIKYQWAAIET